MWEEEYELEAKLKELEQISAYINYSNEHNWNDILQECTHEKVDAMGLALLDPNNSIDSKEQLLPIFAHLGTLKAYQFLNQYLNKPDKDLKTWAQMALCECILLMESCLKNGSIGTLSQDDDTNTGRLLYSFVFLPVVNRPFKKNDIDKIKESLNTITPFYNSALKHFDLVENYITIEVAIPFDYAIAHFANDFISECNNPTEFMFPHYYVRGGELPSVEDIENIIGIIREICE